MGLEFRPDMRPATYDLRPTSPHSSLLTPHSPRPAPRPQQLLRCVVLGQLAGGLPRGPDLLVTGQLLAVQVQGQVALDAADRRERLGASGAGDRRGCGRAGRAPAKGRRTRCSARRGRTRSPKRRSSRRPSGGCGSSRSSGRGPRTRRCPWPRPCGANIGLGRAGAPVAEFARRWRSRSPAAHPVRTGGSCRLSVRSCQLRDWQPTTDNRQLLARWSAGRSELPANPPRPCKPCRRVLARTRTHRTAAQILYHAAAKSREKRR